MQKIIFTIATLISGICYAQNVSLPSLDTPPTELTLFGSGVTSTGINERDFAISPDGSEIYYTISTPKSSIQTIVVMKKQRDGKWSKPEVAPFAGNYSDLEPAFSADGKTLYFASNRPISGNATKDFDIWKVTRQGGDWGKPENLGVTVNTEANEFYPSVAKSGNLYFTAQYKDGIGREDIYVSSWKDNQYQKPVVLDTAVNSKAFEFNAFIDPNEQFILFTSYGRKDDSGGGDLYISVKDNNGKWKPSQNLKFLNSKQLDYCPYVSTDGKALFVTSERHQLPTSSTEVLRYSKVAEITSQPLNGTGNIYWIDFKTVLEAVNKK